MIDPATSSWTDDLWTDRGLPPGFDIDTAATALLPTLYARFGAPRQLDLVAQFCLDHLPGGRIYVYGAGTHTRGLLPALLSQPHLTVLGIVDRLAAALPEFEGLPVVSPQALQDLTFDYVLLSHNQYEAEMTTQLAALGIAADKIVPIYLNPRFRKSALDRLPDMLGATASRRFEHVIIDCSRDSIIQNEALTTLFPPDRTLGLYMGRPDSWHPSSLYETINLHESLDLLTATLARVRPRTVYLRTILYKNFISLVIKQRFPDICVIHELYDFALTWRDSDLISLFGLDARSIRELRVAELYSCQHVDTLVSKRGGPAWRSVLSRCAAPYELYFPLISGPPPAEIRPVEDGRRRLLYGGFFPAPSFLAQFKTGYDFLDLMAGVAARTGVEIDIYNSAHADRSSDALYRGYSERFASGPLRYHARVPFAQFAAQMPRYEFGWLCEHVTSEQPDRHFGVCNRWTGYLSGGLPVLMDDSWKFMAGFMRDYGAGPIIDDTTVEGISSCLERVRGTEYRAGARALRDRLAAENRDVLERLTSLVERRLAA